MPREQRTALKKTAVEETPRGVLESKLVGRVNMPVVAPTKTLGQSLAEGLGMAAKGAASIVQTGLEEDAKIESIKQKAAGITAGKSEALRILDDMPDTIRDPQEAFKYLSEQMNTSINNLGTNNEKVHSSYLEAFTTSGMNRLATKHEEFLKIAEADKLRLINIDANNLINETGFVPGTKGLSVYKDYQKLFPTLSRGDIGKNYVAATSAIIKQRAQDDPNFDWQGAVDNLLKLETRDGVSFATHKIYGKTIDTLESSLNTLVTARDTATKAEAKAAIDNQVNQHMYNLVVGKPTIADVAEAQEWLEEQTNLGLSTEKFSKVATALDAVLERQGFASVSKTQTYQLFKSSALNGKLNYDVLNYNASSLSRDDYLEIMAVQSKFDADMADETKRGQIATVAKARRAGKATVATINADGLVVSIGDDKGGPERSLQYEEQFDAWIETYMAENANNRPPSDVVYAKAREIAKSVNEAWNAPAPKTWAPEAQALPNYQYLKPLIENAEAEKIKKLIADGIITKQNAAELYKLYK